MQGKAGKGRGLASPFLGPCDGRAEPWSQEVGDVSVLFPSIPQTETKTGSTYNNPSITVCVIKRKKVPPTKLL